MGKKITCFVCEHFSREMKNTIILNLLCSKLILQKKYLIKIENRKDILSQKFGTDYQVKTKINPKKVISREYLTSADVDVLYPDYLCDESYPCYDELDQQHTKQTTTRSTTTTRKTTTTNNKQQTTNNKQQTTNNKQQ